MNYNISKEPIVIQEVIDKVVSRNAGAVTTFIGTVREMTKGKKTLFLIYEAYEPMAIKKLEQIGSEIKERWPDAETAITHRVGKLEITDIAVVIAVSTHTEMMHMRQTGMRLKELKKSSRFGKKNTGKMGRHGSETSWKPFHIQQGNRKRRILMINVLLFAQLKDELGKETVTIEGNGMSVAQLKGKMKVDFQLEGLETVMTAVNEEFADDDTILSDGDTVAFIPPVSGG